MFGNDRNERRFEILIEEVLTALEKNLTEHDKIHDEALANYRAKAIEKLDVMLQDAKDGKPIQTSIALTVPHSYKKSFTSAIALLGSLQKAGDDKVEMTASEYDRFVLNEWEWVDSFNASNAVYTATGKFLNS